MVEYRQRHADEWPAHFARRGHRAPRPLAAGVEGAVYRLAEGLVAKVWSGRPPADLDRPAAETAALLTVLRALATVPGTEAMRRLTVQADDRPL